MTAHTLCSFLMPKTSVKFEWGHPNGGAKYRWGRLESSVFDQYLTVSQETVQDTA